MSEKNEFVIMGGSNEYGGQVVNIKFEHNPDQEDLRRAAKHVDPSLPFGFRVIHQKDNYVTIKIHND